jgi:hypothetical protein
MTASMILRIGFSTGDYTNYTVLLGSIVGGGNPGLCLDGGRSNVQTDAHLKVQLPAIGTISEVRFDWWNLQTSPYNSSVGATLYDNNGNSLWTNLAAGNQIHPISAWRSRSSGSISVSGVASIEFYAGSNWANGGNPGPVDLQDKIDNCYIVFTPDGLPESDNPGEEECSLGAHAGRLGG